MRYIVEIDPTTKQGAKLLKYIVELDAPASSVNVHKATSVTDEEMALPGKKPRTQQLEEWLAKPDYGNIDGEKALAMLHEELAVYRKGKK